MIRTAAIVALVGGMAALSAQGAAQLPLSFDVVSVKRSVSADTGFSFGTRPGGWAMVNSSIAALIRSAYPAQAPDLVGAPEWVMSDRYDLTAKAAGNPTRDEIRLMLRTLLAERFKLKVRYDTQVQPIYHLVIARRDGQPGPGLLRSNVNCDEVNAARREGRAPEGPAPANGAPPCAWSSQFTTGAVLRFGGLPLSRLSEALGRPDDRVIVDRTGLSGNYEFTLRYSPREPLSDGDAPSLVTALQEQLGLKLEPTRGPVEVLAIDAVERPTPD